MISVEEAMNGLFALTSHVGDELLPLREAAGRVLAENVRAARAQPPFDASAMDGYALRFCDVAPGARLKVIGEAAAGHAFGGALGAGEAVRIFTGAPMPIGADHVEIQEDVTAQDGFIDLRAPATAPSFVRTRGGDFLEGATLTYPRFLGPSEIALLAAMNVAKVKVAKRPEVAIISTGDELVQPGETPRDDQIIASNGLALDALLRQAGAAPRLLPVARDTPESLASALRFARGADLIVTIGGASVGDHDLVRQLASDDGMERTFYKVAMRPGKALMAGRLNGIAHVGLPGNPVSSLVCGHVFLAPMVRAMLGLGQKAAPRLSAPLAHGIASNGPRAHYMRAKIEDGALHIADQQDSSLLSVLAGSNALAIRAPHAPPRAKGAMLEYLPLGLGA